MFPTFIGILDIQSWWEVPSIAHFCSLFRAAFNLLDFDIEDLEEALLTDGGTEGRLVQELIVKLLEGCLPNDTRNDISTFNYQMFLRRLFRKKCQEYKCENPFNTDVDFELLPLRQKVEILRALCDFRLDAEDVEQSLSNLDSDSLRVEPLGHDRKNSAYWYFYGTRLYREDYIDTSNSISHKQKSKPRDKKRKRRRNRVAKEEEEEEEKKSLIDGEGKESVWQVVCFTQQDWSRLVEKFRDSEYDTERKLYRTLSEDFMPEIPKLFDLKEKQQRRKLLQRNSSRVLRSHEPTTQMETVMVRSKIKTKTNKGSKKGTQNSKNVYVKEETPPPLPSPPVQKKGRQTNNSLASAVGQIVIHTRDEVEGLEKKKGVGNNSDGHYVSSNYGYKYGYSFGIEEEERRVGMHKVLESLKDHVDAWPFVDPVDEEYAPRYYSVVRKPMDLTRMEEKLENGLYKSLSEFKRDFRLIVDNCKQYNGSDNEYTEMAFNLKEAFDKAVDRYLESETSSDEDASSPKTLVATPASPPCPSRVPSPQQNRKRSKKSPKKSKSYKSESKGKSKANDKNDEEEKRGKTYKLPKKKRGKKKSKKAKDEESEKEEEEEEEREEQGSEDAMPESGIITTKRRKHIDGNNLLSKTKKLPPKEPEEFKKIDKKASKDRHQQKKETDNVRPIKESKENKKRKEDFEEDYEPLVVAKSKSRKIEKKELEETEILTDNAKKNKVKKNESHVDEPAPVNKDKTQHIKVKKSRRKEKVGLKASKSDEKSEKSHTKEKEKKSKQKNDELKNGEISSEINSKDVDLESDIDSKETHTSKKIAAFIGDKDIESLDGLKDKISERRREEKLKNEKEKQKKPAKSDLQNMYSKKVPSNGSTFHDTDKPSAKRPKLKKGIKEEKVPTMEDSTKTQDQESGDAKKVKTQTKHTKGFGKEESSIQALNQATEQTLHDINKWLDDAPRLSEFSSGSDSPIFHSSSTESGRPVPKAEVPRKRPSSIKIFGPHGPSRPKKIQRTIDRLQPGKSKGNLLLKKPLNLPNVNATETTVPLASDNDQTNKNTDEEPKLSLGTVLKNADSIQLICKSLVSSPNPNFSNDDDEEDHSTLPAIPVSSLKEEKSSGSTAAQAPAVAEESKDNSSTAKETQKPKTATPNLSAWFKAFGAPKSKKKDEESEDGATKKDGELPEVFCGRQRRMSTGGSSVSESVSSFSQESPPGRSGRSPQGQPIIASVEPQIRGAGFYQDALSTGSSPYNSPYYATPPRYSAQLPPTPSPQNHPSSPAYPSSSYEQAPLYSQASAQQTHQTFQKSPQESSGEVYQLSPTFPQRSPQTNFQQTSTQNEPFNQQVQSSNQSQSPAYSQHSPQSVSQVYPQPSPQPPPSNYSQPSPQQPPTPKYSQVSPQQNTANYSQPSPQASNYAQASPQQPHSPYSQASPKAPPNYSQPSPQQQHPTYAQSPQQSSGYSQLSPQPSANYSQQSPQPPSNYSQPSPQPPSNYSQPSPQPPSNYSQPSPQPPSNYSQPSPQPPSNYSQPSPQPPSNYSQPSPQPPSNYSQPSPQPPSNYSQPSPQPPSNYSQPSPQPPSNYSQPSPQPPSNYSQPSPQPPSNYSQPSPQPPSNYSQPSPQPPSNYSQPSPQPPSNYSQPSPQPPSNYSQPSPQPPSNYSQPSPQPPSNYSQPSPQPPSNYSQPSPQPPPNYSQPSPKPPPATYSQPSPQPPPNYSQPSPHPPPNYSQPSPQPPPVYPQQSQPSNFSHPSPQTHSAGYAQSSPQPLTAGYSQPSPQPRNYSQPSPQQIPTFSQHSPQPPPSYSQPSPQNAAYSQPSPQQPVKYSQPSPQQPANYSHSIHSPQTPQNYSQLSPQQAPSSNYSQPSPSPQQSRNYPQSSPSPQQSRNYAQPSPSPQQSHNYSQPSPSPQQTRNYSQPSPQQKSGCASQTSQQPATYSQPSPQQSTNYSLQPQSQPKNAEEYPQTASTPSNYSHSYKQNHSYIQSPAPTAISETEHRTDYLKSTSSDKTLSAEQQRNFVVPPEAASLNLNANHQIYQSSNQYPPSFNNYPNIDLQRTLSRHGSQEQSQQQQQQQQQSSQERPSFTDLSNSLNVQKYAQQRSFLSKTSGTSEQLSTQDQSQILAFQQNLTAHESLYSSGFQPSGYAMPNSRPVYPSPHYFDTSSKGGGNSAAANSAASNLPPVKKRIYNDSTTETSRGLTQETATRTGQEQFGFDPIMALPQPETVSASQFDAAFVGNLADSVTTNPAYARLGLGLVGRTSKEQQQLLTIPRPPPTKSEHLAYTRSPAPGAAELDLNLLQSLQTAAAKNTQGILSISSRRGAEASSMGATSAPVKTKKGRKSKQQQQQQQQQQQEQQNVTSGSSVVSTDAQPSTGLPGFPQYSGTPADSISLKNTTMVPPAGSAFNFAASTSTTTSSPFYDKDATAAAFAFLDEFRNPNSYYSMALRQQQQQQQQQVPPVTDATQQACNKLSNQPPRNYAPHPFLHSAQRSAAYGPPVSAYVTPHGPNLTMDPTAYQQYIHSLYALQPPPHHHRPSWL